MTFSEFKAFVWRKGWTMRQLRCDVPPTEELLELTDRVGLSRYESFVLRLERESEAFVRRCVRRMGIGYHPDTPAQDYVGPDGEPVLTDAEQKKWDDGHDRAFAYLEDPYAVALDEAGRL